MDIKRLSEASEFLAITNGITNEALLFRREQKIENVSLIQPNLGKYLLLKITLSSERLKSQILRIQTDWECSRGEIDLAQQDSINRFFQNLEISADFI